MGDRRRARVGGPHRPKSGNPGRTYMNLIGREFGLKPHQRKDLQKTLRDENHATSLALKALGVTYGSEGKGKGAKELSDEGSMMC